MNAERLSSLADCYGADPRRWPEAERAAVQAFMAAEPATAERILSEARRLDAALDSAPAVKVSHDLRERVIASAAAAGLSARPRRFRLDPLTWLSGAGMAAACAAGIMVGAVDAGRATADARAEAVFYQASLIGVDDTEVLG